MRTWLAGLCLAWAMCFPAVAAAAETAPPAGEKPGSVEGEIVLHGTPKTGVEVMLLRQFDEVDFSQTTTTDKAGRFHFHDIPPGVYAVGHMTQYVTRTTRGFSPTSTDTYRRYIVVEPGQHVKVPAFRKGHTLRGRMVLPPGSTYDVAWQGEDTRHILAVQDWPKGRPDASSDAYAAWWEAYRNSKSFKKFLAKMTRIVLTVNPDGSFHAFDVPPGEYALSIDVGTNKLRKIGEYPPSVSTTFTMPNDDLTLPDLEVIMPKSE